MSKELIVFTNNGQTYHFNNVTDFRPTTTGFSFKYHGKATGIDRDAMFNNTSAAGYAIADTPEETTTLPDHGYTEAVKPLPIETTKRGHQLFEQANKALQGELDVFVHPKLKLKELKETDNPEMYKAMSQAIKEQANKASQGLSSAFSKEDTSELLKQANDAVSDIKKIIAKDKLNDELKAVGDIRDQINSGNIKEKYTASGALLGYMRDGVELTGREKHLLNKYFK